MSHAEKSAAGLKFATAGAALTAVGAGASSLLSWKDGASFGEAEVALPLAISTAAIAVFLIGLIAILRGKSRS